MEDYRCVSVLAVILFTLVKDTEAVYCLRTSIFERTYFYCSGYCCGNSCCYYGLYTGSIVGIVIGVISLVAIIVSIVVCCVCCTRRSRGSQGAVVNSQPQTTVVAQGGVMNPAYPAVNYGYNPGVQGYPMNNYPGQAYPGGQAMAPPPYSGVAEGDKSTATAPHQHGYPY